MGLTGLLALAAAETALLVLAAPLVDGLGRKLRARLSGRGGPSVWQPYRSLWKLLGRRPVVSEDASFVTPAAPYAVLGAALVAAALVPIGAGFAALGFAGDAFALVAVLAAGRFVLALAAYDSGSALAAMASSRDVTVGALAAPTLALALVTAALPAHATALAPMAATLAARGLGAATEAQVLALAAIAIAVLAERGHIPFDDPDTRLELTMRSHGMLREYAGRHLGLLTWAAQIRDLVLLVLVANLFIPGAPAVGPGSGAADLGLALAIVIGKILGLVTAYSFVERATAKLRFFRVTDLLGVAFAASLVGAILALYRGLPS